jgi:hypothetical protein
MRSARTVKVISARHVPGSKIQIRLKSVLSLYQQCVSPTVTKADLIHNGKYVPKDKYNNSTTNGATSCRQ